MKFAGIILCLFCQLLFSQEKERSYYFDRLVTLNDQFYPTKFKGKIVWLTNSKDSTYSLMIKIGNNEKRINLYDREKKRSIYFHTNFVFNDSTDLTKLPTLGLEGEMHSHSHKKYKNYVDDIESETDSVKNITIVHSVSFANKKRRKKISEHYYFFGPNDFLRVENDKTKVYLQNRGVILSGEDKLLKLLCLQEGKVTQQTDFIASQPINFTYNFKTTTYKHIFNSHYNLK